MDMKLFIFFLAALNLVAAAKAQEDTTEKEGSSQGLHKPRGPFRFPLPFLPFFSDLFRSQALLDVIQNNHFGPYIPFNPTTTTTSDYEDI